MRYCDSTLDQATVTSRGSPFTAGCSLPFGELGRERRLGIGFALVLGGDLLERRAPNSWCRTAWQFRQPELLGQDASCALAAPAPPTRSTPTAAIAISFMQLTFGLD
jgi:hypothetical protein